MNYIIALIVLVVILFLIFFLHEEKQVSKYYRKINQNYNEIFRNQQSLIESMSEYNKYLQGKLNNEMVELQSELEEINIKYIEGRL